MAGLLLWAGRTVPPIPVPPATLQKAPPCRHQKVVSAVPPPEPQPSLLQIGCSCPTSGIPLPIHKHLKGTKSEEFRVEWGWGVGDAILGQSRRTQWNPCGFYLTVQEGGRGRQSGLKIPTGESSSCSTAEAPRAFQSPDISAELSGFLTQFQTLIRSQDLKAKPHEHLKGHRTGRSDRTVRI